MMKGMKSLLDGGKYLLVAAALLAVVIAAIPKPHLLDRASFSPCYVDRSGTLLKLALAEDDRYRVYVPLEKISPQLVEMEREQE